MRRNDLNVPPGHHLVVRRDRDGTDRITIHRTRGFEFYGSTNIAGYVLDAALMHELLGSAKMPGVWHQTWNALVARQSGKRTGYVEITQAQLNNDFGIAHGHIALAMRYFADIGWLRKVRNGLYQLNPWLTFRGVSSEQELLQEEWLRATGGLICHIPDRDYPKAWRAAREAARVAEARTARRARFTILDDQIVESEAGVQRDDTQGELFDVGPTRGVAVISSSPPGTSSTATMTTSMVEALEWTPPRSGVQDTTSQPRPAQSVRQITGSTEDTAAAQLGRRMRAERSAAGRVRLAAESIGPGATPGQVRKLLESLGFNESPNTVKSTLRRARRQAS
ncbi:hypothetical protein AB0C84_44865 [Actinomadura sp. NPDC048955]|uniref:hypothetical protein n=1 Tax=Actinomadura sp. NPDC048955 TaxID=3158228 RepID=UPI0033CDA284